MPSGRSLDVVVYGATGFVGRLVAEYLEQHAPEGVRIGLAGRSKPKLEDIRAGLGPRASSWRLITADSTEPESLAALARKTRVVATTVGPYRRNGIDLVKACAEAGSDYTDLTGEVLFMHDTAAQWHDVAAQSGSRIVHACGFDSIPSDLGVFLLYETAKRQRAGELEDTTLVVTGLRGGISGGTLESARVQADDLRQNPSLREVVFDPYSCSPDRAEEPDLGPQRELRGVERDDTLNMWVGPFIMAGTNTRVVRRSNALLGWAYGRRFKYREVMGFGSGPAAALKAGAVSGALAGFTAGMSVGPARMLLDRALPKPGEGPSEETRRTGSFKIDIHARTSNGKQYVAHVAAKGDPGYAATAVMFGESALCLAMDRERLPARAGVLTPATAMGEVLAERLRAAGHTYRVTKRAA